MSEENPHYIVWSGGADSTYLLYTLAEKSSKENPVHTISITHPYINDEKMIKEKEARKNILKWMKEKGFHIKTHEISVKTNIPYVCDGGRQPLLWLSLVVGTIPTKSDVHFGYIFEDSIWHLKSEFVNAFYKLDGLRPDGGKANLYFDLEWTHKKDIIKKLKEIGIYKYIWTCEEPTKSLRKCGRCTPCETEKAILSELKGNK